MPTISVGPPVVPLHYVGIDVTGAVDTVVWAASWNRFLWKNLLSHLPVDPTDENRMLDDRHTTLPIVTLTKEHEGISFTDTILAPSGVDGNFTDKNFKDPKNDMLTNAGLMLSFIMNPGVDLSSGQGRLTADPNNTTIAADVLYISSHGTATGDMYSDSHPIGSGSKESIFLFSTSIVADIQSKFSGVKWLILSNCNTLREDVNQDWLDLMRKSSLRGILGFQNLSPGPKESASLNRRFVAQLAKGASFKDAWNRAVTQAGIPDHWVVMCHEDAKNDTILAFNNNTLTGLESPVIRRFNRQNEKDGIEVKVIQDPFDAFWIKHVRVRKIEADRLVEADPDSEILRVKITSANRFQEQNHLREGDSVSILVFPPLEMAGFAQQTLIDITLHYIREDFPISLDVESIFKLEKVEGFRSGLLQPGSVLFRDVARKLKKNKNDTWKLETGVELIQDIEMTLFCKSLNKDFVVNYPLWLEVTITPPNKQQLAEELKAKLSGKFRRNGSISAGKKSGPS